MESNCRHTNFQSPEFGIYGLSSVVTDSYGVKYTNALTLLLLLPTTTEFYRIWQLTDTYKDT